MEDFLLSNAATLPERWDSIAGDYLFGKQDGAAQKLLKELMTSAGNVHHSGQVAQLGGPTPPRAFATSSQAGAVPEQGQAACMNVKNELSHAPAPAPSTLQRPAGAAPKAAPSPRASTASESDHLPHAAGGAAAAPSAQRRKRALTSSEDADGGDGDGDGGCDVEHGSDAEARKLEKRRAKNRRTARISRERKQAELVNMKAELEAKKAEVAQLRQIIREKDAHIKQLAAMPSPDMGGMARAGMQPVPAGAFESAELNECSDKLAKCVQLKGPNAGTAACPPPIADCPAAGSCELVSQLKEQLHAALPRQASEEESEVINQICDKAPELGEDGIKRLLSQLSSPWDDVMGIDFDQAHHGTEASDETNVK